MNKNQIKIKSFFKSSPTITNFILKSVEDNKIYTIKEIKQLVLNHFKIDISTRFIYKILKKMTMFIKSLK